MLMTFLQQVQALMPTSWLQNYFHTIQTPDTFENRNAIRYNIILKYLQNKSAQSRQKK